MWSGCQKFITKFLWGSDNSPPGTQQSWEDDRYVCVDSHSWYSICLRQWYPKKDGCCERITGPVSSAQCVVWKVSYKCSCCHNVHMYVFYLSLTVEEHLASSKTCHTKRQRQHPWVRGISWQASPFTMCFLLCMYVCGCVCMYMCTCVCSIYICTYEYHVCIMHPVYVCMYECMYTTAFEGRGALSL